jgi:undecaprenyl-diphosphatase
MNQIHALIFGFVEGITEFLPISSTGHLILTAKLLGLEHTAFLASFDIAIQLGAILAVVVIYWRSLFVNFEIGKRVLIAFLPTAVIGLILYKIVKKYLMTSEPVVLWSLFIGGILLIVFELFHKEKESATGEVVKITYKKAFLIGIFQSFSMIPGVSRSAATILGGLGLGLKRKTIVEFSFFLAVPTMLAATGMDLLKNGAAFNRDELTFLLIGGVASFVVAILSIRFFIGFIKNRSFIIFGVYRILVALFFWCLIS